MREREKEGVRETQLLLHNRFSASTVPGQNAINTSVRGVSGIKAQRDGFEWLEKKMPRILWGDGACPRRPSILLAPFCGAASPSVLCLLFSCED